MNPSTPIADQRFAVIDFESAGASRGRTDVPVQVGIALWSPEEGLGDSLCSFLSTDQKITWAARKVHGISAEDLAQAPSLLSLWPEIRRFLADRVVVAHGHGTEKRFLRAFPGHSFGPWIDTLSLARAAWPTLPSFALGDLCDRGACLRGQIVFRVNDVRDRLRNGDAEPVFFAYAFKNE